MNTFTTTIARMVKIVAPVAAIGALFATVAAPSMAQDVNDRLHRQHARIEQGIRKHDLNKHEVHNLRARDRAIRHTEIVDRRHDHGHLTAAQRARLNHRLNKTSRGIYDHKHDVR